MILEAVVIVLREVLEAALLIALLLLVSHETKVGLRWLVPAFLVGLTGALLYAWQIAWVSEQFDYAGQEILNALLQGLIFASICGLFVAMRAAGVHRSVIATCMGIPIALALAREVSEIFLYLQAFLSTETMAGPAMTGALIGAVTGMSTGVLIYHLLGWMDQRQRDVVVPILLAVVVAGILTQAVSLLEQVDRIPYSPPLWDTSGWLPENSLLGQLLYALLGYEATPSRWHAIIYVASLLVLFMSYRLPVSTSRSPQIYASEAS